MTEVISAFEPERLRAAHNARSESAAATPYLDAVRRYADGVPTRLTVPGHKGGIAAPATLLQGLGASAVTLDIAQLVQGVDRQAGRPSPFELAERRAAVAWGAARTWFLTGGATQGNLAACLAVRLRHHRVAVQRSSHSSTFNGLALAGLKPTWLLPEVDGALGIAHGVTPDELDAVLTGAGGTIHAVFVVSPSYFGVCSDVAGLADVAHGHGAALIVDEAWGAHLRFSPELPPDALSCGADLVISSTHKHLGSLSGSAMLHLGQGAPQWLSAERVDQALSMVSSTSPSSLLMASLDAARARAEVEGPPLLAMAARELAEVRATIASIPGLAVIDEGHVGRPGVAALDPLRLTIDVRGSGRTGYEVLTALREQAGVELELAQERVVVAVFGLGESPLLTAGPLIDGLVRLSVGWTRDANTERHPSAERRSNAERGSSAPLAAELPRSAPGVSAGRVSQAPHSTVAEVPRVARTPREALWAPSTRLPVGEAAGQVCAEALVPYPPGIPAVLPGEVLSVELLTSLREAVRQGAHLRGASDPTLKTVLVVDDPLAALEKTARVTVPGFA